MGVCRFHKCGQDLLPDRIVWPLLILVAAPSLQLFRRVRATIFFRRASSRSSSRSRFISDRFVLEYFLFQLKSVN